MANQAKQSVPVVDLIAKTCEALGQVELGGIKLETASPTLLDVSQLNFDTHVAIQPAAIAYYGSLKKESIRRLMALRRSFDRWTKKKYAEAKASLGAGTGKSTVNDIEARFIVDNEAEIEKWEEQLDRAQFEADTLEMWFEAWRQKSFSIREHAGVEETERFNTSSSMGGNGESPQERGQEPAGDNRIRHVRDFLRAQKERRLAGQAKA